MCRSTVLQVSCPVVALWAGSSHVNRHKWVPACTRVCIPAYLSPWCTHSHTHLHVDLSLYTNEYTCKAQPTGLITQTCHPQTQNSSVAQNTVMYFFLLCPCAQPWDLAVPSGSSAFLTPANVQIHPRVTRLGFSPRRKEILMLESFESVALKGLLTRRSKKMSLADGDNFNAKCHLLMTAPLLQLPTERHLALFQGPDSDQTILYFLLPWH